MSPLADYSIVLLLKEHLKTCVFIISTHPHSSWTLLYLFHIFLVFLFCSIFEFLKLAYMRTFKFMNCGAKEKFEKQIVFVNLK